MELLGLAEFLESLRNKPRTASPRGIKATHHSPKPKPATAERKRRRQMVQASKRRNR